MMGDFDAIAIRVFAKEVVRAIETFSRTFYDLNPILPQFLGRLIEMSYFEGEMAHGMGDLFVINHQVELATGSDLVPVARKIKGWPGDGLQAQYRSVKPIASLQFPHHDPNVVVFFYLNHGRPSIAYTLSRA